MPPSRARAESESVEVTKPPGSSRHPSNPWDIPPPPSHGDFDEEVLFAAIGRALTEWEKVETACAELFAVFVSVSQKSNHTAPAIRAYGTVTSYQGRCEMIKAAAAAYFHNRKKKAAEFTKPLNEIIVACLGFSGRRNEIAHGQVSVVYYSRNGNSKQIGHYLLPSFYNPKKYQIELAVTYEYTSQELIFFRQEFTKLHLKIDAFRRQLVGKAS